ncbi:Cloroperoxidase [Dothidotthia symphoricarpi CBS 119687]|uniref:Cloroperoxidase n=1 Tax=Dothidotthia symphoricarpi CBS 119687 TaxID=1392245 RepID=A0A6A6AJI8_9PLEO|nr:Cloroperoxidase [Dothidotthia symphoricarpi CBS 119687]KAF2132109.1 Cloroperoxidase [Dothidotthia symphoricarpi CBS 119687]
MKTAAIWTACVLSSVAAFPLASEQEADVHAWKAPGSTDRRSPCPMVNTLANHGYLPRNGVNVSMADLIVGLGDGVHLAEAATRLVGAKALTASTTGNSSTFNLDDINKHGIIEHDGSLSRADIFTGDNYHFKPAIWAHTSSYFNESTIPISTAATARKARLAAAQAVNPEWNFTATDAQNSMIETALYLSVMANGTTGAAITGVKKWVNVLFREERLPIKEGWTRPESEITVAGLLQLVGLIAAASA